MKTTLTRLALLSLLTAPSVHAFQYSLDEIKGVMNGTTVFLDTFDSAATPNYLDGTPASYSYTGNHPAPTGGKTTLSSANATVSRVNANYIVNGALLKTNMDPASTAGFKPGKTFEVSAVYDLAVPQMANEGYFIELGDWTTSTVCSECVRLGVFKNETDGKVYISFHKRDFTTTPTTKTLVGKVLLDPGHSQIRLALKKANASSNAITASYSYVDGGSIGAETPISGSTAIFEKSQFTRVSYKAYTPVAAVASQGTSQNLTLDANVNGAGGTYAGKTGNIYVAALYQGSIYFHNGSTWVVWSNGAMPPYATGVALSQDRTVPIVKDMDVSGLKGLTVLVGYGENESDMMDNSVWSTIYPLE